MNESIFAASALRLLSAEAGRLDEFTAKIGGDPVEKKKHMPEFKCAKYRYASVFIVKVTLEGILRSRKNRDLSSSRFLPVYYNDILQRHADRLAGYISADEAAKPDAALFFGLNALIDDRVGELDSNLEMASDWEKIEINERLAGFSAARECLERARMGDMNGKES